MKTIEIYGAINCKWCVAAQTLCVTRGYPHIYRSISGNTVIRDEMLSRFPSAKTVPQIFIGQHHVGGFEQLRLLDETNVIQQLIGGH